MKCNQPHPGFELVSLCPSPTTMTITQRVSPHYVVLWSEQSHFVIGFLLLPVFFPVILRMFEVISKDWYHLHFLLKLNLPISVSALSKFPLNSFRTNLIQNFNLRIMYLMCLCFFSLYVSLQLLFRKFQRFHIEYMLFMSLSLNI